MSTKTKLALFIALFLWASAYVAIRAGLKEFSPEGLALFRYIIASVCMAGFYFRLPAHAMMAWRDRIALMTVGAIGIGIYNLTLNYGELTISSGMASFITSQSPIITTLFALLFLGEKLTLPRILGFLVSIMGVVLIALGEIGEATWSVGLLYILFATLTSSCFSVLQKPFLQRAHPIEATTYVIWGGTIFLSYYFPQMHADTLTASTSSLLIVIYLGIFPAAIGYYCWSYVLSHMPAARAVSFLYFMPFGATLLGWLWLGETPIMVSLAGGSIAVVGVWLVNQSYRDQEAVEAS